MPEASPAPQGDGENSKKASFDDIDLSPAMRESLRQAGYEHPSPVQSGVIPVALTGRDVLGQARTGTGKTASFAIPILERFEEGKSKSPFAIVLAPTRELAVQVRDEFDKLAYGRKIKSVPLYGGKPIKAQITKLERGADVVVGTPGRVLDLLGRGALRLDEVKIVVLDEADRMLDIGFRPDIEKILRRCPTARQTLLLSATVDPAIERLSKRYMIEPVTLDFSPKTKGVDTIEQFYFTVDNTRKYDLLQKLLEREQPTQAIVFCRTKRMVDKLHLKLSRKNPNVACMHGDMAQNVRDRVMKQFRAEEVKLLIATDVVGRGIDVSSISHIFNYDIPESADDYVHRVGRTGRMGRDGVAYTFVNSEQGGELTRIEQLINKLLIRGEMEGFEAVQSVVPKAQQPAVQFFGMAPPTGSTPKPEPAPQPAAEQAPAEDAPPQDPPPKAPPKKKKKHRRAL
ncbi:DEAD-box ATP-dependent RNA helicase CshA [Posidoniimonas polymericola]|uniref:DEAD-box ATP-dependent RNA helicase CshA n=1 Tax=Posidoniimonas polymericola TaxID=2528002 RepID=A0A5C5ZGF0_9BACT|nr:DEAD/DEAH box helicase [Posidoniimonas polymericola]TWT85643.1 DEAD-box ATP-dependent RNA helicase CshA [Posidoniimonas polymericola]